MPQRSYHASNANYDYPPARFRSTRAHNDGHNHIHRRDQHLPASNRTEEVRRPATQQERPRGPRRVLGRGRPQPFPQPAASNSSPRFVVEASDPPRRLGQPRRPLTPQSRAHLQHVLRSLHDTDSAFQAADPYPPAGPDHPGSPGPGSRWRAGRDTASDRSQAMSDRALARLQEASDRLAQTNEDINASFEAMRAMDYMPRSLRRVRDETFQSHENNDRRKRRRVGDKPVDQHPKIEYGYHGQVVAGKLDMEIAYSDGGLKETPIAGYHDNSAAQRILLDDKTVYRSKGTPCNIVLRHRGETTFTLERLVIKMPRAGYADPASAGLVFVTMDQGDAFVRTLKYRVLHFPSCYFSSFYPPSARKHATQSNTTTGPQRVRGTVQQVIADPDNICDTPSDSESRSFSASESDSGSDSAYDTSEDEESNSNSDATSISTHLRNVMRQNPVGRFPDPDEHYRAEENFVRDAERRHLGVHQSRIPSPPPGPHRGTANPNPSTNTNSPHQDQRDANNAMLSELLARGTGVQQDRQQRRQARENSAARLQLLNDDTAPGGSGAAPAGIRRPTNNDGDALPPTSSAQAGGEAPSAGLHLHLLPPRAYFSTREKRRRNRHVWSDTDGANGRARTLGEAVTRVIEFNPPISGRFLILKMWNPRKDGIVEVTGVEASGWAGVRWFPAFEGR